MEKKCKELIDKYDAGEPIEDIRKLMESYCEGLEKRQVGILKSTMQYIDHKSNLKKGEEQLLRRRAALKTQFLAMMPTENLENDEVYDKYIQSFNEIYKKERERWANTPLAHFAASILVSIVDECCVEYEKRRDKKPDTGIFC